MAKAKTPTIFQVTKPEVTFYCITCPDPNTGKMSVIINDVESQEPSLTIPSELEGLPVISLNVREKKEGVSGVKELHLPKTLWSLVFSSTDFPSLEIVDIEPGGALASKDQMLFSADYSTLYFVPYCYAHKTLRVPGSVKKIKDEVLSSIPFADIIFENPEVERGKISNPVGLFFESETALYEKGALAKLLRNVDLLTIHPGIKRIKKGALGSYHFTRLKAPFLPTDTDLGDQVADRQKELVEFELTDPNYDISLEDLRKYENLKSVKVSAEGSRYETEDGVLYDKRKGRLLFYPRKKEDKSFTVKAGTRSIAPLAFRECNNLVSLTLPDSVTDMGEQSICYCQNLESLWLSDGIRIVPDYTEGDDGIGTISNNGKLNTVHLPMKLQYLGNECFYNTHISKVFLPEGLLYLGNYALSTAYLQEVVLPKSLRMAGMGSLVYVKRVTAYEGTAKGLVKALNLRSNPNNKISTWSSSWVTMLGENGEKKGLFYIPAGAKGQANIQELLAFAWDASSFDYDLYQEAYDMMKSGDEKILMALILVIYGGKEEIRPFLKKSSKKAGELLVNLGDLSFFKAYLDLDILSKPSATALLTMCNEKGNSDFAAYLMDYRDSHLKTRSFSKFDL